MLLNKKMLRNIVVLVVLILSINYAYSELSCSITEDIIDGRSCSHSCPYENRVFEMHALNDSQASSMDDDCFLYVYDICCESDISTSSDCDGSNTVIKLAGEEPYGLGNGMTNAHAAYKDETLPEYTEEVCFGDAKCDYSEEANCGNIPGYECLASMSNYTNAHLAECDYYLPRTSYYPALGGNICCDETLCNYYDGLNCESEDEICMGSASVDILTSIGDCNEYLPPASYFGTNICCDDTDCVFSPTINCLEFPLYECIISIEDIRLTNPGECNLYLPNYPDGRNICCTDCVDLTEVCTNDLNCCEGYCSDYDAIMGPLSPDQWHCCEEGDYWDSFSGVCNQFSWCYSPDNPGDCNYNNTNETGYWTDPDCFDDTVNPPLITDACCGVDWYGNLTFDMMEIFVYPWNYTG